MKSKTIILQSNTENKSGRAILTLTEEKDFLSTKLRLYNFNPLSSSTKLGIYHNKQVYAGNMLFKDGAYTSSLVGDFDMNSDFYCAVVDTENNNQPLLSGGTYAGYYFDDTSVITNNLTNNFSPNEILPDPKTEPKPVAECNNKPATCLDDEYSPCKTCKYKAYFYTQNASQPEPDTTPQQSSTPAPTILENIIPQFDYVFKNYPECEQLNHLIPNSKFATISEGSSSYCLGMIYKDEKPQYICYAMPTAYNAPVPAELGEYHQWLPIDPDDPLSDGYHIVYQDANDLKIIEV